MRVFSSSAFSHITKDERRKLDFKSLRCILLGYSNNQKGYRLYDTERRKIIHSCDVQFNELEFRVEQEVPSESPAEPAVLIESSTPESEESNEDEEQDIEEIETGLDEI